MPIECTTNRAYRPKGKPRAASSPARSTSRHGTPARITERAAACTSRHAACSSLASGPGSPMQPMRQMSAM